ncbi:MAG: Mur ligase family protein [Bacilli bacterium]|nr:Mur ligase family protein [Bacilli bacterium]
MNLFTTTMLLILIYNIIKNKKSLHMLQQNLYNMNNRYIKWIKNNKKDSFLHFDLISLILLIISFILKNNISVYLTLVAFFIYIIGMIDIRKRMALENTKKPLVITKRVQRLIITLSIIYFIPIIVYISNNDYKYLSLIILGILSSFSYLVCLVAVFINIPVEKFVYKYYENKAKTKLKKMDKLKVVGITGSYGKTSSKNILNDILNIKYVSKPTPKNLNTEYGLMITINNHLDKFDEIFIAEMGAYKVGEIKTLCDMVKPKYGILTTIGKAHLETFGSELNIENTKFELIESLPSDGVAVLNGDDIRQVNHRIKSACKKIWIGIDNKDVDVLATNIKSNHKGSTFDIIFKGGSEKYTFETKLLGNNNIYNILAGIALGRELGMTINELVQGVRKVKSIEHRLELKKIGDINMIDDAYNSNPVGAKMALDVLEMMPGDKVVVTPGMIELGEKEEELNNIFGRQIAKVADYVILVGEKKTKPIYEGLVGSDFDSKKIFITNDVKESFLIINKLKGKKDIYALFENDLPDSYNEK